MTKTLTLVKDSSPEKKLKAKKELTNRFRSKSPEEENLQNSFLDKSNNLPIEKFASTMQRGKRPSITGLDGDSPYFKAKNLKLPKIADHFVKLPSLK